MQSSRICGRLRPRFRSGHRNVARPAASNAGSICFTVRRTVASLTPKEGTNTCPVGRWRNQTDTSSNESRYSGSKA